MPKNKKTHLKESVASAQDSPWEAKPRQSRGRSFPHISRIIHESRRNAPFLIIAGILILGVLNIAAQSALPNPVKVLLANPNDPVALKSVLQGSNDPVINSEIISLLAQSGEEQVVGSVQAEKNQLYETINKLTLLLKEHPNYSDGYAYRAVIYFKLSECSQSLRDINKAIELDPNRPVFAKLLQDIQYCQ